MAPVEPLDDEGRAGPLEHVPLDHTTLPRHRRPELGPAPHLIVSVGHEAASAARDLLRPGDRHHPIDPRTTGSRTTGSRTTGAGTTGPAPGCRHPDGVAPAHRRPVPPDNAATVAGELARLTTGWRVLAVGRERDVLAVRAAALAAGALDAEITLVPTDVRDVDDRMSTRVRLVFCGACHRRFDARVAVRDHLACPGCRAVLTVAAHHSRRHGAFLGVPAGRRV